MICIQSGGTFNIKLLRGAIASSNYLATSIDNNNQHTFFVDGAEGLFGLHSSFAVDTTS